MNVDDLVAIDFHTHAEEPCCGPRDDGYDDFQAGMAKYFRNPAGAPALSGENGPNAQPLGSPGGRPARDSGQWARPAGCAAGDRTT